MKPLTKARFKLGMYTVGTPASAGLALVSTVALFAGIDSVVSNLIHLMFGLALGAIQAVAWTDAHTKVRALTGQAQQEDEPLIDPDCRDGKCESCVGGPCTHDCHQAGSGATA